MCHLSVVQLIILRIQINQLHYELWLHNIHIHVTSLSATLLPSRNTQQRSLQRRAVLGVRQGKFFGSWTHSCR